MIRFLIALAALLLPGSALAQDLRGTWDFRLEGTTIFRFVLEPGARDDEWRGTWQRPDRFRTDGESFGDLEGGVETLSSAAGYRFLDAVELSFDDPRPGAVPDIFRFEQKGEDLVEMTYVGTGLAPYVLVRAGTGDAIGKWDRGRVYRRSVASGPPGADPAAAAPEPPAVQPTARPYPIVTLPGAVRAAPSPSSPAVAPAQDGPAPISAGESPAPAADTQADPRIEADFLDGL